MLLEGLFYIIFVALIATIFEILFFIYVIFPKQYEEFNNYIKHTKGQYRLPINIPENITKYIEIFNIREHELNNKINTNIIVFVCIEIIVLILILYILYSKLDRVQLKRQCISTFITVTVLLLFQIQMYQFGIKFQYTGAYGSAEIFAIIFNELEQKC
jgi:hypothetical protein